VRVGSRRSAATDPHPFYLTVSFLDPTVTAARPFRSVAYTFQVYLPLGSLQVHL